MEASKLSRSSGSAIRKVMNGKGILTLRSLFILIVTLLASGFIVAIVVINVIARQSSDKLDGSQSVFTFVPEDPGNLSSFQAFLRSSPDLRNFRFRNSSADILRQNLRLNERFFPVSFNSSLSVRGRTVLCNSPISFPVDQFFALPTWVCENISIDSRRLPFIDQDIGEAARMKFAKPPRPRSLLEETPKEMLCANKTSRQSDLFSLCNELLEAQISTRLDRVDSTVAYVLDATCDRLEKHSILLANNASFNEPPNLYWYIDTTRVYGYIISLQCSYSVFKK